MFDTIKKINNRLLCLLVVICACVQKCEQHRVIFYLGKQTQTEGGPCGVFRSPNPVWDSFLRYNLQAVWQLELSVKFLCRMWGVKKTCTDTNTLTGVSPGLFLNHAATLCSQFLLSLHISISLSSTQSLSFYRDVSFCALRGKDADLNLIYIGDKFFLISKRGSI